MVPWSLFFLFSLSLLDITKGDEEVVVTKRHKSRLQPQPHNEWVNGPDNYLYQFHVGQQSWMAAREYCLTQNSDLVAIRSSWQRDWILAHYVPNGHPFHERLIQVGLLAQGEKVRSWSWIDGREENGTVSWISGEPFDHSTDGKEMCAVMRISDGLMDDVDCEENDDGDQLMRFICERSTDRHQLQQKSDNYLWSKIEAMLEFFGIKSPTETQKSLDKIGANETVPDDYIDEVEKLSQQERFELANLRLDNQTIEDDKEEEEVLIEEISKTLSELSNAESILREPKEKKREEGEKPTATMVEITSPKESKNEDAVVNVKEPEVKMEEESLPLMRAGYAEEKDKARGLGIHKKSDVAPLRELDGEGSGDHGEIEKDDLATRVESMLQHTSDTSKLEAMIAEMERALTDIDKKREVGWKEYKEALNTTYQQFQKTREKSEETEKEVKETLKEESKEIETKEEVITEQPTIQARTTQKVKDSEEKEKKTDTTTEKPKEEKEKKDVKEEEEKKEEKEEANVKKHEGKKEETKEKTVFDKELIIKAKQAEIELAQNLITSEQLEGDFDSVENKEMPSADFSPEDDCDEEEEDSELEGSGITPITKEKEKQIDEFLSVLRQFLDRSNRSDIRKILNETDHSKSLLERMKEALKKANDAEFERLAEIAKEKENGEKMKDMDKKGDDMMETKEKEEIMKKMEEMMMDTVKEHTVTVEETPSTELLTPGETVVEVTIGKENHEDTTTSSESKKEKEGEKEKENKEEKKDENEVKKEKEEEKKEEKENVKEEVKEQTEIDSLVHSSHESVPIGNIKVVKAEIVEEEGKESKKPSMEKTDVAEEKKAKEEEKKPIESVKPTSELSEETKVEKKEENTPKKKASKKKSKKVLKEKKESEQSSEQKEQSESTEKNIDETEIMPRRKKLRNSFEKRRADALKRKEKREEKYKKKREGEEKETETETTTVEEEEKEDNQAFVEIRKDEESVERREKEKKERKQKRIAKKKKNHKKKEGENEAKEKKRKRKHRKPVQQRPVQVPVWKQKAEKELLEDIYNGEEDAGYQSDEEGESEEKREVEKKTDIQKQSELKKKPVKAAAAPKPKRKPTREIPEYEGFVEEIKEEEHTKKKETPKNTITPQQRKAVLQKQAQHKKDLAKAQKAQEEFEKRMDVTSMMKKIGEQMSSTDLPPPPQPSIQNILSFQNPMIPTLDTVFKNLGDNFKKLLTQQNFA